VIGPLIAPAAYLVQWQNERVEMSDDMKINFFRKGTVNILINGHDASKWNIMLRGARSGFSSFNISGMPGKNMGMMQTVDSLLGKKPYTYVLSQACAGNGVTGFNTIG
jgi:hypothetical protein